MIAASSWDGLDALGFEVIRVVLSALFRIRFQSLVGDFTAALIPSAIHPGEVSVTTLASLDVSRVPVGQRHNYLWSSDDLKLPSVKTF